MRNYERRARDLAAAWDDAGYQVDEWNARFREEREARWAATDARQDDRDDEIREYIRDIVTACTDDLAAQTETLRRWQRELTDLCKPGPPAFWSYENHRGNIAWRLAQIADDE